MKFGQIFLSFPSCLGLGSHSLEPVTFTLLGCPSPPSLSFFTETGGHGGDGLSDPPATPRSAHPEPSLQALLLWMLASQLPPQGAHPRGLRRTEGLRPKEWGVSGWGTGSRDVGRTLERAGQSMGVILGSFCSGTQMGASEGPQSQGTWREEEGTVHGGRVDECPVEKVASGC